VPPTQIAGPTMICLGGVVGTHRA
jgi:hypothetical protein